MPLLPLLGHSVAAFGFASERSLAWGVARAWHAAGASVSIGIASERFRPALERLTAGWGVAAPSAGLPAQRAPCIVVADVRDDASLDAAFAAVSASSGGRLRAVLHAVAHAPPAALRAPLLACSRADWAATQDVSAYSLLALAARAAPLLAAGGPGGSILCLSHAGAVRAAAGYGVMGPAKAALEALARGLAAEMGPSGVRVNVISAGPVDTLAARGLPGFTAMRDATRARTPLRAAVTQADVGALAAFLVSDAAAAITGQTLYVDAGDSSVM